MRRWAFIIAITGTLALLFFLNAKPLEVNFQEEIENLEINQRVFIQGKIAEERKSFSTTIIELENGIILTCDCPQHIYKESIQAIGKVEEYDGKKQVRILEVLN